MSDAKDLDDESKSGSDKTESNFELVKMVIDAKINENCEPLKLSVEQLKATIEIYGERLKSMKTSIENVDSHYM